MRWAGHVACMRRVELYTGNLLTSWEPISFSRSLLHGVSKPAWFQLHLEVASRSSLNSCPFTCSSQGHTALAPSKTTAWRLVDGAEKSQSARIRPRHGCRFLAPSSDVGTDYLRRYCVQQNGGGRSMWYTGPARGTWAHRAGHSFGTPSNRYSLNFSV